MTVTSGKVTGNPGHSVYPESHPLIGPIKYNHHPPAGDTDARHSACYSQTQQGQTGFSQPIAYKYGSKIQGVTSCGLHTLIK